MSSGKSRKNRSTFRLVEPGSKEYNQVIELGNANSRTLGFLPYPIIENAAAEGRLLAAVHRGTVRGYALFRTRVRTRDISLTHLCVGQQYRGMGLARDLVEGLVARYPQSEGIALSCRKDYDAHNMWPALGFTEQGERPGGGKSQRPLMTWWRPIAARSLFDSWSDIHDTRIVVAVDIGVFHEIQSALNDSRTHALTADWVSDLAEITVTEAVVAGEERDEATPYGYRTLRPQPDKWQEILLNLEDEAIGIARDSTVLKVVAQAAAGGASHLVTRDKGLLAHGKTVGRLTGLTLKDPTDLLLALHSHGSEYNYRTRVIVHSGLSVAPLLSIPTDEELAPFCQPFTNQQLAKIKSQMSVAAGHGGGMLYRLVDSGRSNLALMAGYREGNSVEVTALRSSVLQDGYTCLRQLLHHLRQVVARDGPARIVVDDNTDGVAAQALRDEGFREEPPVWTAEVRTDVSGPDDPLPCGLEARDLMPRVISEYEKFMWPSKLFTGIVPAYVVPIQPEYARILLGYEEAQRKLFEDPTASGNSA